MARAAWSWKDYEREVRKAAEADLRRVPEPVAECEPEPAPQPASEPKITEIAVGAFTQAEREGGHEQAPEGASGSPQAAEGWPRMPVHPRTPVPKAKPAPRVRRPATQVVAAPTPTAFKRGAGDSFTDPPRAWCTQCERRVCAEIAAACQSRFCSLKGAA